MALAEAGGRAPPFSVPYRSLDNSTRRRGKWDPARTSANARRAVSDPNAIAYIGEYNSRASAISIPILNDGIGDRGGEPIPQISPTNTMTGLTVGGPGAGPGEPRKYYPRGLRTYLRLQPHDRRQGGAVAALMGRRRCRRAALVRDGTYYAAAVAHGLRRLARRYRVRLVVKRRMNPRARTYRRLARRIRRRRVGCIAFAGTAQNNAARLFRDLNRAMPRARLFGSDGIAVSTFLERIPRRVRRRTLITLNVLPPRAYPAAGRAFFRRFVRRYGRRRLDPNAIYGYEAMKLLLDSLGSAGTSPGKGARLLRALFATRNRRSVLGTYSFDRNGDTSLTYVGAYRVTRGGSLRFARVVRPRR